MKGKITVEQWCAALRSGKYRQTKDVLYKAGCHCCLGVGVALATGDPHPEGAVPSENFLSDLPEQMVYLDWVGFDIIADLEIGDVRYSSATAANDEGATFAQIADAIERAVTHYRSQEATREAN